ncbi:hypothetical protein ACOME3_009289 [Neoechinorhynchus agilis]
MTLLTSKGREGQESSSHFRKVKQMTSEDYKIHQARMRKEMAEKERQKRLLEAIRLKEERWRNNYNNAAINNAHNNKIAASKRDANERRVAAFERKRQQDEEQRKRREALKLKQGARQVAAVRSPQYSAMTNRHNDLNVSSVGNCISNGTNGNVDDFRKSAICKQLRPLSARLQQTIDRLSMPKRLTGNAVRTRSNQSQSMHPCLSTRATMSSLTIARNDRRNLKPQCTSSPQRVPSSSSRTQKPTTLSVTKARSSYSSSSDLEIVDEQKVNREHEEKCPFNDSIIEPRQNAQYLAEKLADEERRAECERSRIAAENKRKERLAADEKEREERRQKLNAILKSAGSNLDSIDKSSSSSSREDSSSEDASTASILERILGRSSGAFGTTLADDVPTTVCPDSSSSNADNCEFTSTIEDGKQQNSPVPGDRSTITDGTLIDRLSLMS